MTLHIETLHRVSFWLMEADFSWTNLSEPWERLRWARSRKYETATAFADAIGMASGTYGHHERSPSASRTTKLDAQKAMRFAKALGIRWEWLAGGPGEPWLDGRGPATPKQRVNRALEALDLEEQERIADAVEALARRTGTGG